MVVASIPAAGRSHYPGVVMVVAQAFESMATIATSTTLFVALVASLQVAERVVVLLPEPLEDAACFIEQG
jgi:hypothetical protein